MEFLDWLVGFDKTGKINIVSKGDAPISWTSLEDISGTERDLIITPHFNTYKIKNKK
jgi:hypothetical protein